MEQKEKSDKLKEVENQLEQVRNSQENKFCEVEANLNQSESLNDDVKTAIIKTLKNFVTLSPTDF